HVQERHVAGPAEHQAGARTDPIPDRAPRRRNYRRSARADRYRTGRAGRPFRRRGVLARESSERLRRNRALAVAEGQDRSLRDEKERRASLVVGTTTLERETAQRRDEPALVPPLG